MEGIHRACAEFSQSLFREGFLDIQFSVLQQLKDESDPDFVFEIVSLFFKDSEKLLADVTDALGQSIVDFPKVSNYVHQLKGSSSSVGAYRLKNACIAFNSYCEEKNVQACIGWMQKLKQEYFLLKTKLETLFRLEQQLMVAGGSIPLFNFQ